MEKFHNSTKRKNFHTQEKKSKYENSKVIYIYTQMFKLNDKILREIPKKKKCLFFKNSHSTQSRTNYEQTHKVRLMCSYVLKKASVENLKFSYCIDLNESYMLQIYFAKTTKITLWIPIFNFV